MKRNIILGLKWNTLNQIFSLGSKFLVTIILSRLLEPSDFGLLAMIFSFTIIADVFIDAGFRNAIIQEKDVTDNELSSIYWLNMAVGLLFTLVISLSAPAFVIFFDEKLLQKLTVVISFLYIINPSSLVQEALLTKYLKYKALSISQMASKTASALIGVYMAYSGWGYWSLVASVLFGAAFRSFFLWFQCSWKPVFHFSIKDLKKYWKVSSNLLYSNILFNIVNRVDYIVIGRLFSSATLGLYSKARDNSFIPGALIANVIRNTFFGIFSNLKNNMPRLQKLYIETGHLILIALSLIFSFIAVNAKELIVILLGEKWVGMTGIFQFSCIYVFAYCNTILRVYLLNALGRTDIDFRLGIFAHPVRLLILMIPLFTDVNMSVYFFIAINTLFVIVSILVYDFHINKILNIPFSESLKYIPFILFYMVLVAVLITLFSNESALMALLKKTFLFGLGSLGIFGIYFKQIKPLILLVKNKK